MSPSLERLSLDLLRTFVLFAQVGRVEEAARQLGMTQAAVSFQLKKLESEIGAPLFTMVGRKKVLTEFAQDLFQSLAPPLLEMERRLKEVSSFAGLVESRTLRVGCRPELMSRVAALLSPKQSIQLQGVHKEGALKALREGQLDVAIMGQPPEVHGLIAKRLFKSQVRLLVHRELIDSQTQINYQELWKKPYAAYRQNPPFIEDLLKTWQVQRRDLHLEFVCEDWRALVAMMERRPSWTLIPDDVPYNSELLLDISAPHMQLPAADIFAVYPETLRKTKILERLFEETL